MMSRGDAAARLVDAAVALGTARGAAALSLQQVADAAGVSKALVLYHFTDKDALLRAVIAQLGALDAAALEAASMDADPLEAWRAAVRDVHGAARRVLLAALLRDPAQSDATPAITATRHAAATRLGLAMLASAGLRPRIAASLVGHVVLQQLDGFACTAAARDAARDAAQEAVLDAMALALLGLGR